MKCRWDKVIGVDKLILTPEHERSVLITSVENSHLKCYRELVIYDEASHLQAVHFYVEDGYGSVSKEQKRQKTGRIHYL